MSDENLLRTRQNCCRLCLAPDSECISILNSYAADKEPLVTKIHNCVSIKISPHDRLSLRICHACISYLNSWQSFKNRCVASQSKQRNWLDTNKQQQLLDNNVSISTINTADTTLHHHQQQQHHQHQQQQLTHQDHDAYQEQNSNLASSILDGITSLKKRKSLTVYPIPAVDIKDEPPDTDEDYHMKLHDESDEMVDPTLFLERTEEEGDEPLMQDTAAYDYENDRSLIEVSTASDVKEASCRACNLKFSTRANARRHERNLHPNLFELSASTPNSTPVTKPTPALAAVLEMQRAAAVAAAATAAEAAKAASSISQQKYRQEVVNAFNKCEAGGFDYDSPEKYQHLLTDEKIVFLQQNEDFLKQYQNMTCRCCKKFYATYKNFMAHMRKKYAALPRNLCFNCLKLNDSKALFISHLKRRNCINLYKVLHALMAKSSGFASAVAATAAAAPEKLRAKELLVNKMYECKLCPKQFRLKLDFRSHVYEEHTDAQKKDAAPTQCNYCSVELEDPAERKRHHNNMECIVCIRCLTCDAKFDNHQKFLDHAYDRHLAGFGEQAAAVPPSPQFASADNSLLRKSIMGLGAGGGSNSNDATRNIHISTGSAAHAQVQKSQYFSRMPQACPICGQQYNNYNNVLRHMESKHPDQLPQTYKCVKCGIGYPRLSNLREHMVSSHASDKARHTGFEYIVNADAIKMSDGRTPNVYTGRYDYVMKDLMSITNGGTVDDDDTENTEHVAKKMRMDTSGGSSTGGNNSYSTLKECPICNAVFNNNIGLSNHMRSHTAAAQSAAMAALSRESNSNVLSITATGHSSGASKSVAMQQRTPAQQAIFRRSLEQAADRRFRRMRCRICQRRFSSKKSYRFHMLNDHQIRNVQFIKCKLCDAEFAYEKGLKVHMFKIHNTLLKDDMIIKQFECDICSIVYRTEEQLRQHKKTVHGSEDAQAQNIDETLGTETNSAGAHESGLSTPVSGMGATGTTGGPSERISVDAGAATGPLYWYQCKYCASNFNTNKKLAIHINSHDEFDSNDYSCKDCGNVYSGRKSLWVHRYKKHPQIPDPSECVLCKKMFFDRQMLENHIPTCNRKPITATGAVAETVTTGGPIYRHKTGDDDEEMSHDAEDNVASGISAGALGGGEVEITAIPAAGMKIKLPEVACTICGQRFTDQELFAKHIQMHERELYTDNPLAAMFDTGPADPNQFYLDRVNDNGEYACDLCSKTFTQMTAFKVHRKWHFRGDSKQNPVEADVTANATALPQNPTPISHPHLLGLQAVGLMPNPRPHSKSQKRRRELKCEYCPSTFISNNNLRRHIYELHKDAIGNLPSPPKIHTDGHLMCRRCNVKFETKLEWIEHKVADARIMKPFGPFQWGCELCGAYVSRKEKLINHIHNHMKEKVIVPVEQQRKEDQEAALLKPDKSYGQEAEAEGTGDDSKEEEEEEVDKEEYEEEVLEDEGDDDEDEEVEADGDRNGEVEGGDDGQGEVDKVEADEDYEEAEEEYEDVEDMGQIMMHEDDNANDGQHDADDNEDDDIDDEDAEMDEEDDDVEDTNDDETNEAMSHQMAPPPQANMIIKTIRNSADTTEAEDSPSYADDDDDDDEIEEEDEDDEEEDADTMSSTDAPAVAVKTRFNCDLCSGCFTSQQELQKHVKMHFLNGPGSVTLTEIKSKPVNKSRSSSSSDVVTVSSS